MLLTISSSLATNTDQEVTLYASYSNPVQKGNPVPRTPARPLTVYIQGNVMSFNVFLTSFLLELEGEEGNILYSQNIPSSVTSCEIPDTFEGTYIVKLVLEDVIYWGEITL